MKLTHTDHPQKPHDALRLKTLLPILLFVLVLCITVRTTWHTTKYFLDGDSSSELVLAKHLNDIGKPLSTDWYYSTELRVLNTQLVYAPLFSLFSDWHMVRFAGALILQTLLVISLYYLCRQAQLSSGAFFLGASLLLLPVSVSYGRIVLYHTYYIPHIVIGFLITALFMSVMKHHANHRRFHASVRLFFLLLLSLVSGLGGVRQGMITHCPLLLCLLHLYYKSSRDLPIRQSSKEHWSAISVALFAAAAFAVGYLLNTFVLSSVYSFENYNTLNTKFAQAQEFPMMLFGLLHAFGFRADTPLFSVCGILSLGAVFSCIYCITHGLTFLHKQGDNQYSAIRLLFLFPFSALFVMLSIFVFLADSWYYPLYLIPVAVWFVPMLSALYDLLPERIIDFKWRNVGFLLCTCLLLSNGFINTEYFVSAGEHFPQPYEGLTFQDTELKKKLENPLAFLLENGYEFGFSNVWSANVLTEMSDGKIKMVNLNPTQKPIYFKWLMQKSIVNTPADKAFLLLLSNQEWHYQQTSLKDHGELVYPNDGNYLIYSFDDLSVLQEYFGY